MKIVKLYLSVAVAAFAALSMLSCGGKSSDTPTSSSDSLTDMTPESYSGKIAFIRMDSLMSGYGLYMDMGEEFTQKQQKAQAELASRGRSLEREVMEFQDKAQKGLITTYQGRKTEEDLQKKQQNIVAYRDRVMAELSQEEAIISEQISKAVLDYLKEYNVDKKYSMILQTMGGNPIILADPALDITAEVLAELNARYEKTLSDKQAAK